MTRDRAAGCPAHRGRRRASRRTRRGWRRWRQRDDRPAKGPFVPVLRRVASAIIAHGLARVARSAAVRGWAVTGAEGSGGGGSGHGPPPVGPASAGPRPGTFELFRTFLVIGASAFGMAIMQTIRSTPVRRGWLSQQEVDEGFGVVQLYLGPVLMDLAGGRQRARPGGGGRGHRCRAGPRGAGRGERGHGQDRKCRHRQRPGDPAGPPAGRARPPLGDREPVRGGCRVRAGHAGPVPRHCRVRRVRGGGVARRGGRGDRRVRPQRGADHDRRGDLLRRARSFTAGLRAWARSSSRYRLLQLIPVEGAGEGHERHLPGEHGSDLTTAELGLSQ